MGSCSNPHFFSAQNDGPAGAFGETLPEGLGGVQDHLLGALRGLMSTTNYVLRLSANAYILIVFVLFFALLGHLLVRYVGRVYAAVRSLYGHGTAAASPVEPTVLMVWEILMLLLSTATSVVVSLLWPIWLPFVLVILGWNTIAWGLATAAAVLWAAALYAGRSRLASPAFWRARYFALMRAFTSSPYAVVESEDEDEGESYTEWEESVIPPLHSDAMHNNFVQLREECLKDAERDAIEGREEGEEEEEK